ncbi:MAG: radical SAM protein [Candidatus Riflebacteria bacterium]|jgi:wyosine [tRNA(Phe)-imidazoG37] synthetase (radical SAM superfamily)|nr:radical SAM protein [Candidatus Riflebacteria bacterium]
MYTHIFGPVPSRRLGTSLGVDLTPTKTCSFDCIYCQLSRTTTHTNHRNEFCKADDVLEELRSVLREVEQPDWITLSGTGEPTLHSGLGYILAEIKKMNNAPTCVITNGSLLHLPDVRKELMLADRLLPTLCTVNQSTYEKIHRPVSSVEVSANLEGLRIFTETYSGAIEIEIFVCPEINDTDQEIEGLSNYLASLKNIESIYLNSAVRMPLEKEVKTADQGKLNKFRDKLNLPIPITTAFEHSFVPAKASAWNRPALSSDILKLLLRHPCSKEQLERVFNASSVQIDKLLNELVKNGTIAQEKDGSWALIGQVNG